MALTISEKFRAAVGGKAWRTYEVTHVGSAANSSITAGSMDLDYIDCIVGVNTNMDVQANAGSILASMLDISISANHEKLVWVASTVAGTQMVTIIGW